MNKLCSLAVAFVLVMLLATTFVSCGRQSTKVRIGYLDITNSLPLYVAIEKEFLKARGIDAELTKFPTSNDLVEALVAERIDVEVSASTPVLYAMELRSPGEFKIFSVNSQSRERFPDYIVVRKDLPITKMTDLKGRTLGTFPGSTFKIITRLIVRNFLDPDQVKIEQVPPPAQVEALASGRVDAIYTLEPFCTLALEKGNGKILEAAPAEKYVLDPLPGGVAAFSASFIKTNPEKAREIAYAFDDAIEFIRANEMLAREYLPKYTSLDADIVSKMNLIEFWKLGEIQVAPLQKYFDILYEEGEFNRKIETEKLVFKP